VESWANQISGEVAFQASLASDISESNDTENIVNWYSSRGARKPHNSDMDSTRSTSIPLSDRPSQNRRVRGKAQSKTAIEGPKVTRVKSDSKLIYDALLERNIDVKKVEDDADIVNIKRKILHRLEDSSARPSWTKEEETWKSDLVKCQSSHEALFQRTIMMDLIDRCNLDSILDYVCEVSWIAKPVPSKDRSVEIVEPVPDLAVAFRTTSLIRNEKYLPELGSLRYHMCPEGVVDDSCERAFHFFSVEVKGKRGDIEVAKKQNLITASQGLYNMYLFMKETGHLNIFFDQVRFFSVAAAGNYFEVRVHRAVKVEEQLRVTGDYSLGYSFDIVFTCSGGGYGKSDAVGMVKNILCEYGVKQLHGILKKAVEDVLKKFGDTKRRKRPASEVFESFGSQRQRLRELTTAEA
jgi:hypothetical protein